MTSDSFMTARHTANSPQMLTGTRDSTFNGGTFRVSNSLVNSNIPQTFQRDMCVDALLSRIAMLCSEVPPSWRNHWEFRERLHSGGESNAHSLTCVSSAISHGAADTEWQRQKKTIYEREPMQGSDAQEAVCVGSYWAPPFHAQDRSGLSIKRWGGVATSIVCS